MLVVKTNYYQCIVVNICGKIGQMSHTKNFSPPRSKAGKYGNQSGFLFVLFDAAVRGASHIVFFLEKTHTSTSLKG